MGQALRQLAPAATLAAVVLVPIIGVVLAVTGAAFDSAAWVRLQNDMQWRRALGLSLWTGLSATILAYWITGLILSWTFGRRHWQPLIRSLGALIAAPHAAVAVGVVLLLAPSGWLLRIVSPWLTGFGAPPPWETTQDPFGLGLIFCLIVKEVPFLMWSAISQLQRADVSLRLQQELQLAHGMGYSVAKAWWHVAWPQISLRLTGPLFAVFAYGLTVVDMAQIIGPQRPPTLSVLAWNWLSDADPLLNKQGAAAAWVLALILAICAAGIVMLMSILKRVRRAPSGVRNASILLRWLDAPAAWCFLPAFYVIIALVLAAGSVIGTWPFPALTPAQWTLGAWQQVAQSADTIGFTLALAFCSSALALIWSVAWLECAPRSWDEWIRRLLYLPMALPGVLWVIGLHRVAVSWALDGKWLGLLVAHTLAALPYCLIALSPSYCGFDRRYAMVCASMGKTTLRFLLTIKWPILKAGLSAAFAVGFSVSIAQYLATLFVGAGRYNTLTTEAVTLASGGARNVLAAYATMQWLAAGLIFLWAARIGRGRFPRQLL
jgi:putative thiamine transport system permease protein